MDYKLGAVNPNVAKRFITQHHYAKRCPLHCLEHLGLFKNDTLVGVALWGWGVGHPHTIQKLWPGLNAKDYRELNRLCVLDSEPRNTESWFIAECIRWFRSHLPAIKVLITWADGMRGKPGYVYQASNWLYAGRIESEFYVDSHNDVIHPRTLINRFGTRKIKFTKEELKLQKLRGYQFLYVFLLGTHKEKRSLMASCKLELTKKLPQEKGLSSLACGRCFQGETRSF